MSDPAKVRENAQIRAWAVERGLMGDSGRGRIPPAVRERYDLYVAGQDPEEPGYRGDDDGDQGADPMPAPAEAPAEVLPGPDSVPADEPFVSRERRPRAALTSVPAEGGQGLAGRLRRARKGGVPAVREPGPARKRVSLAGLVGNAWGLASRVLSSNTAAVPVARVLQMQAPVAGVIVDRMARETFVDRVLQPLARAGEKGEAIYALVGPPVLTAMIAQNPASFPFLAPLLAEALEAWADIAGPEIKKQRERAEKRRAEGIDGRQLVEWLFSPVEGGEDADGQAAA